MCLFVPPAGISHNVSAVLYANPIAGRTDSCTETLAREFHWHYVALICSTRKLPHVVSTSRLIAPSSIVCR